ncbi:MAG TPA: prepilin-type N-terminal cleavage/methylation domain-containing protein [Acidimicrobiales bacterium]|nr:prepilin-type N-terminal cleavage/methylation domain-containing protein [Acidimicrobiales bacterium]
MPGRRDRVIRRIGARSNKTQVERRGGRAKRTVSRGDDGMTLVELLITMLIVPLVIGALAFGLVAVLSLQSTVSGRITDSGDAQTLSASFSKDVQSAQALTDGAGPICGSGNQVIGLKWGSSTGGYLDYVSYNAVQNVLSTTYSLIRSFCSSVASSTPNSIQTVATDLSATSALAAPSISCAPTASGCASTARTGWISTSGVTQVTLKVTETQSVIAGSTTPFAFALVATPRAFTEATNVPQLSSFAPFTLLSATSSNALSLGNNSVLSIDVGTGTDNGALNVASPLPGSVSISPNSQLLAASINTSDSTLNSVSAGSGTTYPSSEYYSSSIGNPFSSLSAPADPPGGGSVVSCTDSNNVYTCPPGYYTTDPGLSFANNATVFFTPGGNFWFEQGLTLANNVNVTFATGTYIFDGAPTAFTTANNTIVNATSGVLFYINSGAVQFGNNAIINCEGLAQYQDVVVWDAAAVGTTSPITLGNNGSAGYGYGGIYVPNGEVILNNNGTVTAAFLVANTAVISNNVSLNIVSP